MLRSVKTTLFWCLEVLLRPGLTSTRCYTNVGQDDKTPCQFKHLSAGLLQNKSWHVSLWSIVVSNSLQGEFLHDSLVGSWFWWDKPLDDVCYRSSFPWPCYSCHFPLPDTMLPQPESEAVQLLSSNAWRHPKSFQSGPSSWNRLS